MSAFIHPDFEMLSFFELTPDLVCIAGRDGFFKKVNRAVIEKLEYTEEELFTRPIFSFMHPDDRAATGRRRAELLNGKPLINFQNRYIAKSGRVLWLDWTSIYLPDRRVVFAIAKDVSEQKRMQEEVEEKYRKFKSLAAHFKTSIEKDRKYLSMELHEELAQLASVVRMEVDWVRDHVAGLTEDARARMDHALAVSGLLINGIRRISYSISTSMLDDLGLREALKWLCSEFSFLNSIPCSFHSKFDIDGLDHAMQVELYRICQETLSKIAAHGAKSVNVLLDQQGPEIRLSVMAQAAQQKQVFEQDGLSERAASINGSLSIHHDPHEGLKVCFAIAHTSEPVPNI